MGLLIGPWLCSNPMETRKGGGKHKRSTTHPPTHPPPWKVKKSIWGPFFLLIRWTFYRTFVSVCFFSLWGPISPCNIFFSLWEPFSLCGGPLSIYVFLAYPCYKMFYWRPCPSHMSNEISTSKIDNFCSISLEMTLTFEIHKGTASLRVPPDNTFVKK